MHVLIIFTVSIACVLDPASVAEIVEGVVTTNSISISWTEPMTAFDLYKLYIAPNDGPETLPISVDKYVTYCDF